eukprot:1194365-Prorocentrum_minimum.AAC.9
MRVRKQVGGELKLNSPVVGKVASQGLSSDSSQLGRFFGVRKYSGGEFNSPAVEECLNKGVYK